LSRNCLVKDVHDGKIEGMVKMAGRRRTRTRTRRRTRRRR